MIILNQVSMAFGNRVLFCDVNLNLTLGNRYALVGSNGSGKSTFFRLLTGEEELSLGEITIPKQAMVGWLKQDQFRYEATRISDVVLQGKQELWKALQEQEELLTNPTWDEAAGFRFASLEETIVHYNGYQTATEIANILVGLGIPETYHDKPLSALSGGYKLRVLLAQALFSQPSVLLLDEPTNHLDIVSIRWLEKFLTTQFSGLLVFISHDVQFIDNVSNIILDIDYGEIRQYVGKYQHFLAEKSLVSAQKLVEKKAAEEKIAHMQKFVDRFRALATKAAQARSRMRMIEKIEIPDVVNSSRMAPHFKFIPKRPSGKLVCKIKGLAKSYGEKLLFNQFTAEIQRGDKIAIIGENGKGKSTLLKIILGEIKPDGGTVEWGSEVRISYCSQDHHDLLNYSCTALHWLSDQAPTSTEQQVRKALGQMLFTKDDVNKNILALSGGEAARLLLAKTILEEPNVLVLDEPTNHMDIETIDALADALAEYQGTLITVSHNRYFMSKFANKVYSFIAGKGIQVTSGPFKSVQ